MFITYVWMSTISASLGNIMSSWKWILLRNESYQTRKNQTLPHRMKIDDRKNVKFNDAYAKECIPKGTIKHASCFSCLYRENNYICNSLGKYKRTIFIERSENVNRNVRTVYFISSFKIFYKFFVKKEKMYKKKIMVTCIYSTKFLKKSFCNL